MRLGRAITHAANVVVLLSLRWHYNAKTGELETVRVLGVPLFDRRRWNARQARQLARARAATRASMQDAATAQRAAKR